MPAPDPRAADALGCAGWGAGQLEQELSIDNSWLTAPADPSLLFDTPLEERWRAAAAQIGVDPDARTARVQAGVLLGELDRETQAFGLAAPSGIVTHTGVAGLTLGGGIGWIMRKHGLSIDQLRRVDVVTADGELVKASADENADLFWGLRGGGGNFGIVTEFEFDLVPLGPTVMAGPIFCAMEDSPEVLRFYRDWVAERRTRRGA